MKNLILGFISLFSAIKYNPVLGSDLYDYYPSINSRKLSSNKLFSVSSIPSRSPTYNTISPSNVNISKKSKKIVLNAENIFLLILLIILTSIFGIGFLYCCWFYVFCRCEKDRCFSE